MDDNQMIKKKSPKQRFLLVIGILFFAVYLFLGLAVIFWKKLPLNMDYKYRIAFGVLLIVYAFIRFLRLLKSEPTQE
ncbi:hypothetical protein HUK80_17035 [Flavobacterium sp. MAH-1]|uniref:Uncharacterized protein n=1 Tax=Flavobacterium agri TaxID=2743471 RepID=A0A7Y8Y7Q2_9FLAO|nr:hypothetical protein [Flavobacterium agri]NYA72635.1 hypothetical protein [Flavobacterium agri]